LNLLHRAFRKIEFDFPADAVIAGFSF